AWLPRLLGASNFHGVKVTASAGVQPHTFKQDSEQPDTQEAHGHGGGVDPHAWQSLKNGMIYARNIADGLSRADPANAAVYRDRAGRYIEEMKKLDTEIRQALRPVPPEKRKVVVLHD